VEKQLDKILIADDDEKMRALIKLYLGTEGYSWGEAQSGQMALDCIKQEDYHLVILDIMMPDLDGWTVCRSIRQVSHVPIIFLTARGEEFERVLGFEMGADDYLVKPFSPRELIARINALLRRTRYLVQSQGVLTFPGLTIFHDSRQVKVEESYISLTPKEYDLLYFLAKHDGKVLSREQLTENIWGYNFFGDLRTVDTHIKQLRDKLGKNLAGYVKTIWGVGYKFEVDK
jgi:two-component system, OmpR family, response regulator ResD